MLSNLIKLCQIPSQQEYIKFYYAYYYVNTKTGLMESELYVLLEHTMNG